MKSLTTALLAVTFLIGSTAAFAADKMTAAKTVENLKAAITGETTASAKYAAYAKKAREEGLLRIAYLFDAASKAEGIHAANHRAVIEQMGVTMGEIAPKFDVKSTRENLRDAITGESYEVATMYPGFIKTANAEKANAAMLSFNYAYKTEQKHKELYTRALAALEQNKVDTLPSRYLVCPTCGNTYDNEGAARCSLCLTSKDRFQTFDR
jgi:rubrerythrin